MPLCAGRRLLCGLMGWRLGLHRKHHSQGLQQSSSPLLHVRRREVGEEEQGAEELAPPKASVLSL